MKIDFSQTFKDLKGEVLKDKDAADALVNLKDICHLSLLAPQASEKADGSKKVKMYQLAQKLNVDGEIDLKAEEVVLLKEVIGKVCTTIIVGQAYEMLEPA